VFFDHYRELMYFIVAPLFAMTLSYSRRPPFRVHLAGSPSASSWHTDKQVTGRDDQINIWLPFADTCAANTLWVETDYGRGDYTPVVVEYGQMLLFDGGLLSHGTVKNTSGQTRVSMDLRFAPHGPGVLQRFFPRRASLCPQS
jgi:ectoine hydroxylase-related dioxygenase (phytanoyl-CoA dioxygenase family)